MISEGLQKEWNTQKNVNIDIAKVAAFSNKKVWWKCKRGHEWMSTVGNRSYGKGCPYCSGNLPIEGETDLATRFPELALEWNMKRNKGILPKDVTAFSNKKVWWQCKNKGHEWMSIVNNRSKGNGCPYCAGYLPVEGETDLATRFPEVALEWNMERNIGVLPKDLTAFSNKKVWWKCADKGHEWMSTVNNRSRGNTCPYCAGYLPVEGETDLATIYPELAKEWDAKKNRKVLLKNVKVYSNKKVWWKCKEGHEWQATVNHRSRGTGCPFCSGRLPIEGETDLATRFPKLASEWDVERNIGILPKDVTAFSGKKVWWKCKEGHEWQTVIHCRSNGNGCPYCAGQLPIKGETDLATKMPELAKEWNMQKNRGMLPKDVMASSRKKVWWKCKKGHEWQATINHRSNDRGCPYCAGNLPIEGETDLATKIPELVEEWNVQKNGGLLPKDVTASSSKKVWWKCKKGHEWQAIIDNRSRKHRGCPYCSGHLPIAGETDLETKLPELAKEWNMEKNRGVLPKDVTAFSKKKVWWKCEKGHEWQAIIYSRSRGARCPYCFSKKGRKLSEIL